MFTINANCYICCEKGKDKTVFLPESDSLHNLCGVI